MQTQQGNTRGLHTKVSKDELKHWLNTGHIFAGLILIIDGAPLGATEKPLHNAAGGRMRLIFGFVSRAYATLKTLPVRSEETTNA
jgi:hypothetical protein